jgi:hypothetical protein
MRKSYWRKSLAGLVVVSLLMSLCAGCEGMKYHEILGAAAGGALVGWIIGHQYHEDGNGALIGAGAGAAFDFLKQLDNLPKHRVEEAAGDVRNGNALLSRGMLSPTAFSDAGL